MAEYTIGNAYLTVRVSSLGAELQSVVDERGRERLWQGDPAYWTGRAPVLFPYAGGLLNDHFVHNGKEYHNRDKHGFARVSEFVREDADGCLSFLLDKPMPDYPFDYALRVTFALDGRALKVTYEVRNTGGDTLYFGLGAHEAFATDGDISHYTLLFDEDEKLSARLFNGAQMTRDAVPLSDDPRRLALSESLFERLETVMLNAVRSRAVTLINDLNDQTVRVSFDGFDYLLLWKKPGARYLCIEPWVNPPEYVDGSQLLKEKTGIVALAAGDRKAYTHIITFE